MNIVDYADEFTRRNFGSKREQTIAIIKPDAFSKAGLILDAIQRNDLIIANLKSLHLNSQAAQGGMLSF